MSKRPFRLPSPAIVISMIALVLVLGGTAVAARTASDPDKKADTKLIKTLARTLSVKHAANATLLGGKSAASLETSAYTYQLPEGFGSSSAAVNLPGLPPGIYYASYDMSWHLDTPGPSVGCYFLDFSDDYALSYSEPDIGTDYVSVSGSGVVDTRTHPAQFTCSTAASSFQLVNDTPVPDVTFVRIDKVTSALATIPAAHRNGP